MRPNAIHDPIQNRFPDLIQLPMARVKAHSP